MYFSQVPAAPLSIQAAVESDTVASVVPSASVAMSGSEMQLANGDYGIDMSMAGRPWGGVGYQYGPHMGAGNYSWGAWMDQSSYLWPNPMMHSNHQQAAAVAAAAAMSGARQYGPMPVDTGAVIHSAAVAAAMAAAQAQLASGANFVGGGGAAASAAVAVAAASAAAAAAAAAKPSFQGQPGLEQNGADADMLNYAMNLLRHAKGDYDMFGQRSFQDSCTSNTASGISHGIVKEADWSTFDSSTTHGSATLTSSASSAEVVSLSSSLTFRDSTATSSSAWPGVDNSADEAFADHITNAVQNFLAGDGEESDGEFEDDKPILPKPIGRATLGPGAEAQSTFVSDDVCTFPEPSQMQANHRVEHSMPAVGNNSHFFQLQSLVAPIVPALVCPTAELNTSASSTAPACGSAGDLDSNEWPLANMQDFLDVLRRRPLPYELDDQENLPFVQATIAQGIHSLYTERIRPVLCHVERRLREVGCAEVVVKAILLICAREPQTYNVLPPMGGNQPVIFLAQEPEWFEGWVDVDSLVNTYSMETWDSFRPAFANYAHLLKKTGPTASTPYAVAVQCRKEHPHLAHLALGEIEHMVRLSAGRTSAPLNPARIENDVKIEAPIQPQLGSSPLPHAGVLRLSEMLPFPATKQGISSNETSPSEMLTCLPTKQETSSNGTSPQAHDTTSRESNFPAQSTNTSDDEKKEDFTEREDWITSLSTLLHPHPHGMLMKDLKELVRNDTNRNPFHWSKFSKLHEVHHLEPLALPSENAVEIK